MTTQPDLHGPAVSSWLRSLATALAEFQNVLDELDAGAGDGDHGATMVMGFRLVIKQLDELPDTAEPADVLRATANAFAQVGGSIGPLWGSALLRAARCCTGPSLDIDMLASALAAAATGMTNIGSAHPGDRTLLDAFVPSAQAFAHAAQNGANLHAAAQQGYEAALAGATSTATMPARRGRAARNPELAAGKVDAGAASIALAWTIAVAPAQMDRWRATVQPPAHA